MVVLFYRLVALAPPVSFQFPNKVNASGKNFYFVFGKITFYLSDSRKQLLVYVCVYNYVSLVKKFGNALSARKSMLVGCAVYKRVKSAFGVGMPV